MKNLRFHVYPARQVRPSLHAPGWHTFQAACGVGLAILILVLAFGI
jgi:hypothetical protein